MPANHASRRTDGLESLKAAQINRHAKREFVEDEGGLSMSKGTVKIELEPDLAEGKDDEDSEDEEEDDSGDDDDKHELDDEIQERIDDFDCPYDSSIEGLPSHPAFHPDFKQAEHDCVDIIGKAVNHLQNAKYGDAETLRLAEEGLSIKDIKYALGTKVAMIGNSGVGKSSLINSLFDTPKLAPEGSTGSSCTHVVTEIRRTLPNQRMPFAAEITFFDEAVRRLILQKHLENYYRYFLESQEGLDRATIDDSKTLAMTALETFKALFCDLSEFQDDVCAKNYLSTLTSENDERILLKLYEWTDLLLCSFRADSGIVFREASTVEELADQVEPFTRTPCALEEESSAPAPWPLVQIVKLGVQSAFVKTGLVIADLPGLSDTNTNRVRATQRYRRECSFACVVAPISRVLTDNLVEGWLQEAFERWGSNKALICTHTDAMDLNTQVREVASTRDDMTEHNNITKAHTAIVNEIATLNMQLQSVRGKARRPLSDKKQKLVWVQGDHLLISSGADDGDSLNKAVVSSMRRESLIKLRNKKVINAIRQRYRDITDDPHPFHVFCVSNSDYTQHRSGYIGHNVPMTLQTTGIPALRAFLLGLPASSKFSTLEHLCEGTLPEFISSLEMWSTQSVSKRKKELQKIVSRPREVAYLEIAKLFEELKSNLAACVLTKISDSVDRWVAKGKTTCQKWATWNQASYAAFVKHDGNHATKSKPQQSWNSQLLEPVVNDLRRPWKTLDETWKETTEKHIVTLTASLDAVRDDLKATRGLSLTPMDPFISSLLPKKAMLRELFQKFVTELETASRNTKVDATTDELDAFLVREMARIYMECAEHSGFGSHGRRCASIDKEISSGDPFHAIYNGVKEAFEDHLNTQQTILLMAVNSVFDRVLEDFGRQFVVKEVRNANADKLRASLRKFCKEASSRINGPVRLGLSRAKVMAE